MTKTEKAISWMESIANDNTHGYSQSVRWGPSYDCSSMVISAWQNAGVPVKDRGATFTGNMYEVFIGCNFANVTSTVNLATGAGLKRGDVLLNNANHTAMSCGDGKVVHARSSEGTNDTADNSGNEIRIQPYWNYPWDCVLRYKETETDDSEAEVETPTEETTEESVDYEIPQPDIPYEETDISDIPGATHDTSTYTPTSVVTVDEESVLDYIEPGVHVCRPTENSWFVWAMQYFLKERKYYTVQATGIFDIVSCKAVIKFQREKGLMPDCQVGELTWSKLYEDLEVMIGDEGDKGFIVKALQYLLRAQGYYIGDGEADGIFGTLTYKQVVRFQESRGLEVTGLVTKEVWDELVKVVH